MSMKKTRSRQELSAEEYDLDLDLQDLELFDFPDGFNDVDFEDLDAPEEDAREMIRDTRRREREFTE